LSDDESSSELFPNKIDVHEHRLLCRIDVLRRDRVSHFQQYRFEPAQFFRRRTLCGEARSRAVENQPKFQRLCSQWRVSHQLQPRCAAYLLFTPLLGWLGAFLTGSDTSSNALFAAL
jgi:hypothetical protein